MLVDKYYENSPSKIFFPTSQESEGIFFSTDDLHTRIRTWKPSSSARAGLSPKKGDVRKERKRPRKARRWLRKKGKVPCVLNQEISFFGSRVFGF